MSRRTVVLATSNLSGKDIEGEPHVVKLDLGEGLSYQLDLTEDEFVEAKRTLQPYLDVADVLKGRTVTTGGSSSKGDEENQRIREWGRANGFDVPVQGRIPNELREAYAEAN